MRSSDDEEAAGEVVRATAQLIRRAWALLGEATLRPPLRSDQLSRLLVLTRTRLCEFPFQSRTLGMAIPWGAQEHAILIDRTAARADYAFTLRHELAHVLAGEVSHALFLATADTLSYSERRADLFAIADLVPARMLTHLRGTGRRWSVLELEVQQAFRELTGGWSAQRVQDRAALRVRLFREHGL